MGTERLEQLDSTMPVGTKFLVELEVVKNGGYSEFIKSLMVEAESNKFIKQNGCKINVAYSKYATIDNDNLSAKDLLQKVIQKLDQGLQ